MPGRPGTGGRQPFAAPYTATEATLQLIEELGVPNPGAAGALSWEVDAQGDGIVFARLSTRETQQGETALGQVHPARALAARLELIPRFIVVTTMNSGGLDYDERNDFMAMEAAATQGWLRWVMWRDAYRIARDPLAAELFFRFLRKHDVTLYLTELGRAIEWNRDRLLLRVTGAMSAEEREQTKARTHGALKTRWLQEGRGYPGAQKFGFRRNEYTKFLEIDPQQWPHVKWLHYHYAAIDDPCGTSTRRLRDELGARGCELSDEHILTILRDPAYTSGQWSVTYEGVEYPIRRIPLADPIPAELFQRNQERLALQRARYRRVPPGTYLLNTVIVVHERCSHLRDARGLQSLLRCRTQEDRPIETYRHRPWVPKACYGWSIGRDELDRAVLHAVTEALIEHTDVLTAWRLGIRRSDTSTSVPQLLSPEPTRQVRGRIRSLDRQRARLHRSFLDRLEAGDDVDERAFRQLVGALDRELDELRQRLEDREPDLGLLARPAQEFDQSLMGLDSAVRSLLSPTPPEDLTLLAARAALVATVLKDITVRDVDDGVAVTLRSALAPPGTRDVQTTPRAGSNPA